MYVCQVAVEKLERSAAWAVCWTRNASKGSGEHYVSHVRLWGSEGPAKQHAEDIKGSARGFHVVVVAVARGCRDELWIRPATAKHMTIAEVEAGWYFEQQYTKLIGDEVRKVCDQIHDDVHAEATARP